MTYTSLGMNAQTAGKTGEYGLIWDDDASAPSKFNTCYHTKESWNCPLIELESEGKLHVSSTAVEGRTFLKIRVGCAAAADYLASTSFWPVMASVTQLKTEAVAGVRPDVVRDTLNIAQEVGELMEAAFALKALVRNCHKLLDIVDGAFYQGTSQAIRPDGTRSGTVWVNAFKRFAKKKALASWTLRDWLSFIVSADLMNKFAVQPILRSLEKVNQVEERLYNLMNKFTAEEAVLHGVAQRSATSSFTATGETVHLWGNTRRFTREVHAYLKVRYSSQRTKALQEKIRAALTGRTRKHLASAAWELLPMSFILDMFVDFGGVLRQLALEPITDVAYTVLASGYSSKEVITSEGWLKPFSVGVFNDVSKTKPFPVVTGTVVKSIYYRWPEAIDTGAFAQTGPVVRLPSWEQALSIGEVLYTIANSHRQLIRRA